MIERVRAFLRDFRTLAAPYWSSEERWSARGLLLVVVSLSLGQVYLLVLLNTWYQQFYDSLQKLDQAAFGRLILRFAVLAACYIAIAVYSLYLRQMLEIRWRRWLTDRWIGDWLADRAYYRMRLVETRTDNPDQRIAEDLRLFVAASLELSLDLLSSLVTLGSFIGILWTVSGSLPIPGTALEVPAYMVWAALLYSLVGTWLTHRVGRPLAGLNFMQQRYEADFRFGLVRLRETAEGVALYRGEAGEAHRLSERFSHVLRNWWEIMRRRKKLGTLTAGYAQAATLFPFIVAAPRFFSKQIQLGGLMQISNAFGRVQESLSWFVSAYVGLAEWKATVDRLITFRRAIVEMRATAAAGSEIAIETRDDAGVELRGLTLSLPDGTALLRGVDAKLERGEPVLITGPSGSGKSTLFRALAGIWPFGGGSIKRPSAATCLFLPQRPYIPIGTLRAAVSYPSREGRFPDEELRRRLRECRLEHLVDRLDESMHWEQSLSPGEQQRLSFARALLHRPEWLFLDEACSALDAATEGELYELLERELRATTRVSISHRAEIARFHDRRISFTADGGLASSPLAAAATPLP